MYLQLVEIIIKKLFNKFLISKGSHRRSNNSHKQVNIACAIHEAIILDLLKLLRKLQTAAQASNSGVDDQHVHTTLSVEQSSMGSLRLYLVSYVYCLLVNFGVVAASTCRQMGWNFGSNKKWQQMLLCCKGYR